MVVIVKYKNFYCYKHIEEEAACGILAPHPSLVLYRCPPLLPWDFLIFALVAL